MRGMEIDDEVCNEMRERLSEERGRWSREGREDGAGEEAERGEEGEGDPAERDAKEGGQHRRAEGADAAVMAGEPRDDERVVGGALFLGHNGFGDVGVFPSRPAPHPRTPFGFSTMQPLKRVIGSAVERTPRALRQCGGLRRGRLLTVGNEQVRLPLRLGCGGARRSGDPRCSAASASSICTLPHQQRVGPHSP
jgi:hypothetical protein